MPSLFILLITSTYFTVFWQHFTFESTQVTFNQKCNRQKWTWLFWCLQYSADTPKPASACLGLSASNSAQSAQPAKTKRGSSVLLHFDCCCSCGNLAGSGECWDCLRLPYIWGLKWKKYLFGKGTKRNMWNKTISCKDLFF